MNEKLILVLIYIFILFTIGFIVLLSKHRAEDIDNKIKKELICCSGEHYIFDYYHNRFFKVANKTNFHE